MSTQPQLPRVRSYLPSHHETRKVRHVELLLHVDGDVDAKANEREQEPGRHEGEAQPAEIARKRQHQEHHGAGDVGCDCVQVRLDGPEAEPADDLGQEKLHGLQGDAEADFDAEDEPAGGLFEDEEGVFEVELLVDDGGAVGLHAVVGEVFLLPGEETRVRSGLGEVPEGEEREGDGAAAFHDEEVAPVCQGARFDLEHAECEEPGEGRGDALGRVEDGETAGQFIAAVEPVIHKMPTRAAAMGSGSKETRQRYIRGKIINHQREEGTLRHSQEPPNGHQPAKVHHGRDQHGEAAKREHHSRQDAVRAQLLAQDAQERGGQDVRDEEDAQDGVILRPLESQRLLQPGRLCVSQVGLVETVEQVHAREHGQDAQVELPYQGAVGGRGQERGCCSPVVRGHGDLGGFFRSRRAFFISLERIFVIHGGVGCASSEMILGSLAARWG